VNAGINRDRRRCRPDHMTAAEVARDLRLSESACYKLAPRRRASQWIVPSARALWAGRSALAFICVCLLYLTWQ